MAHKNLSKDKFDDEEQLQGSIEDEELDEWPIDPDGVDSLDTEF